MSTRPSNDAIAQAFWETVALEPESHPGELYTDYVVRRAREIDAAAPTPPKQEVGEMDRTAPPRVWLQVDTEGDPEDRSEAIPEDVWMDMSWHYSPIGGQEIEYVRSDLTQPAPCPSCEPDGMYATDGTGPWDCYRCGKKAPTPDVIRDAERYRWLRDSSDGLPISAVSARSPALFDAAIDAAIREQQDEEKDNG